MKAEGHRERQVEERSVEDINQKGEKGTELEDWGLNIQFVLFQMFPRFSYSY